MSISAFGLRPTSVCDPDCVVVYRVSVFPLTYRGATWCAGLVYCCISATSAVPCAGSHPLSGWSQLSRGNFPFRPAVQRGESNHDP